MKALSIWQPWASLIIAGHKKIETRFWSAPYRIRGQRIAIASTKSMRSEQRRAAEEEAFQQHFKATGLPALDKLPMGCVLGTAIVASCRAMDPEFLECLDDQEEAFGIYAPDRFAWFLEDPQPLQKPVPVRGAQGCGSGLSRNRRAQGLANPVPGSVPPT